MEDLKSSTDDGDIIKGKILELENLIKKYYTEKAKPQKFVTEKNGRKKGKDQLVISLNLKKNREKIKCGIELKTQKVSINMI